MTGPDVNTRAVLAEADAQLWRGMYRKAQRDAELWARVADQLAQALVDVMALANNTPPLVDALEALEAYEHRNAGS